MHKLAILLKTFRGDVDYVKRLIPSFEKHNQDGIPLFICAPEADLKYFEEFCNSTIELLSDESITDQLVSDDSIRGIRPGYINQEIVKLAFWESGLCENYFCMDSDGVFIRDFYYSDFMFDSETPYTILVEDNELKVDPEYYTNYWAGREELIRQIQKKVGLNDSRMLTCHGFAIFSVKVLESFNRNFLRPNNLSYSDILQISPYEFSWYNMWLQKDDTILIKFREHIIKYFHQKSHHDEYLAKGVKLQDIARGYIGYAINSNYSRGFGVVSYEDQYRYGNNTELSVSEIADSLSIALKSVGRKILRKLRLIN